MSNLSKNFSLVGVASPSGESLFARGLMLVWRSSGAELEQPGRSIFFISSTAFCALMTIFRPIGLQLSPAILLMERLRQRDD
ncbi:hypothetical protein [Chamaesiphon sp. OTE_8_metabat_110]|uniref:hypothetical protein n=1 Tax=Chamaesiphon sp. OTE_8_metabat_110 TaxID=2964696 RepID=UPI00286B5830|nr:hypothetical protein [Chamaesiphon sp. OTE_8_metabat_110]